MIASVHDLTVPTSTEASSMPRRRIIFIVVLDAELPSVNSA